MSDLANVIPAATLPVAGLRVRDELLRSTVRIARLALGAAASSVFVYHPGRDELVFEASSGAGEDRLVGMSVPADRGIAGWVWNTGEPLVVRDVRSDRRFDAGFAESTGYVPDVIAAAPLWSEDEELGVIEVLDPVVSVIGDLAALDLLTEIAAHCAAAISLLRGGDGAFPVRPGNSAAAPVSRLEAALAGASTDKSADVARIVAALADMLEESR